MDDPCIIVNARNEYFWHWCAAFSPRYDGDESFTTVAGWTPIPGHAYVFSSRRTANAALRRIWDRASVIAYSECTEDFVEPRTPKWLLDEFHRQMDKGHT